MFRTTDRQATFDSLSVLLPPEKLQRLKKHHWAGPFREKALPVLLAHEGIFAPLFCEDNGRPNKPVAAVLGVLILKEMFDLTYEGTLEQFEFNSAWQYALNVELAEAHLCQKTLHNFCVRMMEAEARGQWTYSSLFDEIARAIIEDQGLKVGRQRLDSTHIRSNMAVLSRLGLFTWTITSFLKQLGNRHGGMFKSLPGGIRKRYLEREGYFADSPSSESRRRLSQCAADLWRLVDRFRGHRKVSKLESYRRLERLLEEQCIIEDDDPTDPDGDGPEGVPVRPKDPKVEKIPATSLQGSDADATYGHKGKGHQTQVAETCAPENPMQVVTLVELEGAHESDQHAPIRVLDTLAEKDCQPDSLLADTNYGSGQNIVDAAARGVELVTPSCGREPNRAEGEVTRDDFEFSSDGRQVARCPGGHAPVEQGWCDHAEDRGDTRRDDEQCHAGCAAEQDHAGCDAAGDDGCDAAGDDVGDDGSKGGRHGRRRYARMDLAHCAECPLLGACPARWSDRDQTMTLTWSPAEGATSARRREEKGKPFKDRYRLRSGIEATNSEYKRGYGGGRLRVRGRPAVDRTVKFKFMALNIKRWAIAIQQAGDAARKSAKAAA